MILTTSQLHLFIGLLAYYLKHRGYFMNEVNRLQTEIIYNYNQTGREAKTEEKRKELWAEADHEEKWLEERLYLWRYECFYLRKFLQELRANFYRERNDHAIAA